MQALGHVFVELYVEDTRYYLRIFRDALGLEVVRDEGDWVELRSSHGTVILNRFDDPDPGHPFAHYRDAPRRGVGVEIGIVCDGLRDKWEKARRLEGCDVSEIVTQEWGMTDFRILTPHGYYLRVTTPRP
ncbi:MAG TPA: VOC family protein [Polyangiaceae bacterium]|jgi:catechol 2,3-dioxygenase-like lactoylglutathione lyase family enzyme